METNKTISNTNRQILTDEKIKIFEKEEYEVYDRNMRLWGVENQKKLSHSRVLLINLTTGITELAKNLILSGVNIFLYDKNKYKKSVKVKENDIITNFFISKTDLGKERVKVIIEKLSDINNFIKLIEVDNLDNVETYTAVIQGFTNFKELAEVEDVCHKKNVPYYSLISCGLYGFLYSNLWQFTINKVAMKQTQSFSKQIDQFILSLKNVKNNKKSLIKNNLFFRHHLNFDFEKVFLYVKDYAKFHNIEYILENEEFMVIMKKLINNFSKEFNPVCSTLGGILSQEIIKLITLSDETRSCFYIYDAEKQSGLFFNP